MTAMRSFITGQIQLFSTDRPLFLQTLAALIFAAALPFSVTFIQGGILLLLTAGLWGRYRDGTLGKMGAELRAAPLALPWLAYLAAGVLAAALGVCPVRSLKYLNSDLLTAVAFFSLYFYLKPQVRSKVLNVYILFVSLAAAYGLYEALSGLLHGLDIRANATSHPVRFGEIMVIGLTLVITRILRPRQDESKMGTRSLYAAALLIFPALALSQSRGSYLGLTLALFAAFVADRASRPRLLRLAALCLATASAFAFLNPVLRYKVGSIFSGATSAAQTGAAADSSINTRLFLWKVGGKMLKDRPVTGSGPGSAKVMFSAYCDGYYPEGKTWSSLHNIYIHHAAERGLLGLGALLLLFLSMLRLAWRNFKDAPSYLTLWPLCLLPGWYLMNVTEISFQHVHTAYAVFFSLAVSASEARRGPAPAKLP